MYEQLQDDHQALGRIAEDLRARTAQPRLTDPAGLGRCRWQLARTLTRHLALEDTHVYARLDADPRPGVAAVSRRYKRELGALRATFDAHMIEWTGVAVARDWEGYRRAVHALLTALEARIRCEDDELYPLIAPKAVRAAAA